MSEPKPCDEPCLIHSVNYHRRHLPEAPAAAQVYPAIAAYLDECHSQIIELTEQRDRWQELAAKRKERMHRFLDLDEDEWVKQRDRIDTLTSERDRARAVAVALEQQNARALELLESRDGHDLELGVSMAIDVLRGDDAED